MEMKRKLYKNMSIISFTIVFILMLNLIMPIITKAEESNSNSERINMEFVVDRENNIIAVEGKIPEEYNGYELYWANKNYNKEKPTNPEENYDYLMQTIEWFEKDENKLNGKETITVEGNIKISSKTSFENGKSYAVLCVAHGPKNEIMMSYINYDSKKNVEKTSEPIKIELSNEDKKITIHASDESAKINVIKIMKSDIALKVDDFKEKGNAITNFTQSNNVTATTTVEDYGIYYIYVENEQGSKYVEPIVLKAPEAAVEDDISVELYRITDEKYGDIAIRATSKTGKITGIKYYISGNSVNVENEENRNMIKQSGTSMTAYGTPKEEIVKSDSKISDEKYITIFVESSDGNYTYEYWSSPGKIGGLNKVDIAPWENNFGSEEQEIEQSQEQKTETEEPKVEQPQEQKTETEEPKVEQPQEQKTETEGPKVEQPQEQKQETEEAKVEQPKEQKTEITEKEKTENQSNDLKEENNTKTKSDNKENEDKINNKINNKTEKETNATSKYEESALNTYVSSNSNKNEIPQTGDNNTLVILGIVMFSVSGIFGLVKYKKEEE